jgi:hypothetical protein
MLFFRRQEAIAPVYVTFRKYLEIVGRILGHGVVVDRKEIAMLQSHTPTREQVREWLRQEIDERRPPPNPLEIRRQLGWSLVEFEYDERCTISLLETPL